MFHVWMSVGLLLTLAGFAGVFLPVLPGGILSVAGMLVVEFMTEVNFGLTTWIIVGVLIAAGIVSDYVFPLLGAKRGGGTKAGTRGSIVGMVGGFLVPPWGLILGPIIGAFVGEYLIQKDARHARRAARGSFLGSTASTVVKLIGASVALWYVVRVWIAT